MAGVESFRVLSGTDNLRLAKQIDRLVVIGCMQGAVSV